VARAAADLSANSPRKAAMSIAAISPSFASAVPRSAVPAAADSAAPVGSTPRVQRDHSPRHELIDAMKQALGVQGSDDKAADPALHRFAHALQQDLRTIAGGEWGDISQRLSTLATAAAKQAVADVPDQPNPVTTATMAVHIMKVPSSHLLAAFVAMQRALMQQGEQQEERVPAPDTRSALADLAHQLSSALEASGAGAGAAVLDLSA
jgi:HPt (histidine-containing phosphotransfer) domain-containing protein